mgnify:FL=1
MKTDNTAIQHSEGATVLTGDAVELYRRANVLMALRLYNRTGMKMNRGATISHLLKLTAHITGKTYQRNSKADRLQAEEDLRINVETLKAAIPHIDAKGKQL